jgi:hypothetical protein
VPLLLVEHVATDGLSHCMFSIENCPGLSLVLLFCVFVIPHHPYGTDCCLPACTLHCTEFTEKSADAAVATMVGAAWQAQSKPAAAASASLEMCVGLADV